MTLLRSSRRKQKLGPDPQNTAWRDNDSRFGKTMLEKMGWKEGHGLGRNEQGISENLKLKPNFSNKGLGCTRRSGETWLAFNDDYEAILKDLSKKNKTRMENLEAKHSDRKDSLHKMKSKTVTKSHQKDMRLTDLSSISESDKCGIFGRKLGNKVAVPLETEVGAEVKSNQMINSNMMVSKLSVQEYFAKKMWKFAERRNV